MNTPKTAEFDGWYKDLGEYHQALVDARLLRIKNSEAFGEVRALGKGMFELKWKNGLRVYFGYVSDEDGKAALMLLGGDKNGQTRDIAKARTVLARETA